MKRKHMGLRAMMSTVFGPLHINYTITFMELPGFRFYIPGKDSFSFAVYAINLSENNTKQKSKKEG